MNIEQKNPLFDISFLKDMLFNNKLDTYQQYNVLFNNNVPNSVLEELYLNNKMEIDNIINKKNDIESVIFIKQQKDVDNYLLKIFIDKKLNEKNFEFVLPNLNDNIFNYIVEYKNSLFKDWIKTINPGKLTYLIVHDNNISASIKNSLILNGINEFNVFDIINYISDERVFYELLNNKQEQIDIAVNNISEEKIIDILGCSFLPNRLFYKILNEKKDIVDKSFCNLSLFELMNLYNKNKNLKKLIYNNYINEYNILDFLRNVNDKSYEEVLDSKYFNKAINKLNQEELTIYLLSCKSKELSKKLYTLKKDVLETYIYNYDEKKNSNFVNILLSENAPLEYKNLMFSKYNIKKEDFTNILTLLKIKPNFNIVLNYYSMRSFVELNNISFEDYIQYGLGNNEHDSIEYMNLIINNNKIENFIKFYAYLNDINLPNHKKVSNFLDSLMIYIGYEDLFNEMDLNDSNKNNIKFLLKHKVNNLKSLDNIKYDYLKEKNNYLSSCEGDIHNLKNLLSTLLFGINVDLLNDKLTSNGNSNQIKELMNNISDKNLLYKTEKLLIYTGLIEKILQSDSSKGLYSLSKKILDNYDKYENLIIKLYDYDEVVRDFYECESNYHLTDISKINSNEIDLSRSEYCLLIHCMSENETIEEILYGNNSGDKNFISLTPISNKGLNIFDNNKMMVVYDYIKPGNFICSSKNNIGSNNYITKNSSFINLNKIKNINQVGIISSSEYSEDNSETLCIRNGMVPVGIAVPPNKELSFYELEFINKYQPKIIHVQELNKSIDNPLKTNIEKRIINIESKDVDNLKEQVDEMTNISKYTGRKVAIFTDSHGLYEPTLAVLEDIKSKDINEIYSLGDNIGTGPDSDKVMDLIEQYGVISIAGNSEYYVSLGIEPFSSYFDYAKELNQLYTNNQLSEEQIGKIKMFPASIDLILGGKNIALCHFANDVRYAFEGVWTYQISMKNDKEHAHEQFYNTNSKKEEETLKYFLANPSLKNKAIESVTNKPLFEGKQVDFYDAIIQGHVHFKLFSKGPNTDFYSIRAVGMAYQDDPVDTASYIILNELSEGGFEKEEILVKYDRNKMIKSIENSDLPYKGTIEKYTGIKK